MARKANKRKKNKVSVKTSTSKPKQGLKLSESTDFGLERFESLVYQGKYTAAVGYLINLLRTFEAFIILPKDDEAPDAFAIRKQRWSTRLASACCALFASPNWDLNDETYYFLTRFHDWLSKIYELSTVADGNYVLDLINSTEYRNEDQKLKRFYLHLSLNSPTEIYQSLTLKQDLALPILLSMVGDSCTLISKHEENRSILIQNFDALTQDSNLHQHYLGAIHKTWMFCSYAIDDRKHLVKLGINRLIRKLLSNVPETDTVTTPKDKPSIGVLIEVCKVGHVMYRCYADRIKSLSDYYDVTIYANKDTIDDTVASFADKTVYVDLNNQSLESIANKIRTAKHDMIFYPSLGMANWTVFMCNLRLAPVQCMALGHPATSCSSQIDFVVHPKDVLADPQCFTEKVVVSDFTPIHIPMSRNEDAPSLKQDDGVVRIAIVSKFMKINLLMIEVCKELQKRCKSRIEFHFFPDTTGLLLDYITNKILTEIPASGVYPSLPYDHYMQYLTRCDVRIGTFPFAGTNTTIDCFALGIPTVAFDGPEVSSHFDSVVINRHCPDVHDELVSDTVEDLVAKCIKVIDDIDYRQSMSEKLMHTDLSQTIYKPRTEDTETTFAKTLKWAYDNIETIRDTDEQVFHAVLDSANSATS